MKQRLDAPPRPEDCVCTFRGRDVQRILEREFGVLMSLQAVYDLLARFGYSSLLPRPQHEDANPEVQEFFKEIVVEQIDAIAGQHPDRELRVYFEDEARFGTQGTITRVWARKGSRPRAVRQNGRELLYVLMAVCISTGSASALIMPELNTAVLNLFLEQFARELPKGVHAVLIWDGAGYHTSGDLVVPENVSLIQLPPYSPESNPVENLWHSCVRIIGPIGSTRATVVWRVKPSGAYASCVMMPRTSRASATPIMCNEGHKLSGIRIR